MGHILKPCIINLFTIFLQYMPHIGRPIYGHIFDVNETYIKIYCSHTSGVSWVGFVRTEPHSVMFPCIVFAKPSVSISEL